MLNLELTSLRSGESIAVDCAPVGLGTVSNFYNSKLNLIKGLGYRKSVLRHVGNLVQKKTGSRAGLF
jgi:hypothetical protein